MAKITVMTPTYNREHTLGTCYKSLLRQSSFDFEWLVIDDGSTDNTQQLIKEFQSEAPFKIKYLYKENGGKHTAWNLGVDYIITELTFVVDSDDYLTDNSIETILLHWEKFKHMDGISGIFFLKQYTNGEIISDLFKIENRITNSIDCLINNNFKGDYSFVFVSRILKMFPFPVFKNERFIGETTILTKIGLEYNSVYINEPIYIAEYLEDGLTNAGRKMRIENCLGGMEYAKVHLNREITLNKRIKSAVLYITYGMFAKKGIFSMIRDSGQPIIIVMNIPIGILLYVYWKIKYYNKLS